MWWIAIIAGLFLLRGKPAAPSSSTAYDVTIGKPLPVNLSHQIEFIDAAGLTRNAASKDLDQLRAMAATQGWTIQRERIFDATVGKFLDEL